MRVSRLPALPTTWGAGDLQAVVVLVGVLHAVDDDAAHAVREHGRDRRA